MTPDGGASGPEFPEHSLHAEPEPEPGTQRREELRKGSSHTGCLGFALWHPVEKMPWHVEENHHQPLQQSLERVLIIESRSHWSKVTEQVRVRARIRSLLSQFLSRDLPPHKAEVFMD